MNFIAGGEPWPVTRQHAAGSSIAAPRYRTLVKKYVSDGIEYAP